MGAPLAPGWAVLAAFLGQTWLHHYWEGETTRHGQHDFPQELFFSAVGHFIKNWYRKKDCFPELSYK